jgi:two-component system, sensor histidine kinase
MIHVLVIDDSLSDHVLLAHAVKAFPGFRWSWALTMKEGQMSAEIDPPDLVLLDLNLGETNGMETYHLCRTWAASTPIVVRSERLDDYKMAHDLAEAGSDGLVSKSSSSGVLFWQIRQALPMVKIGPDFQEKAMQVLRRWEAVAAGVEMVDE